MDGLVKEKICVVTSWPLREGWERDLILRSLLKEGIYASQITWLAFLPERPYSGILARAGAGLLTSGRDTVCNEVRRIRPAAVLACGEYALSSLTGREGIDKWHCSVLRTADYGTVIPCYPADRVAQDLSLQLWVSLAAQKLAREAAEPNRKETPHVYLLNPPLEETLAYLERILSSEQPVALDIETGRGQINTVGFAVSPYESIAINVLPERLGAAAYYTLWERIRQVIESPVPKLLQNFIYEHLYLSAYGIRLSGVSHDTMIAQKLLWPEFEMGLHAVGRMYADMPYWKDDGKSWNNIRDWDRHYEYNCKDTCGTYAGYLGQHNDLIRRGLLPLHDDYIRRLYPAVAEMCSWGLPVCEETLLSLRKEIGDEYCALEAELRREPGAAALNPRSPAQLKEFLRAKGYTLPKKYDSATKTRKESTDEKSLKKLRMKHPEDPSLSTLLRLSKLGKAKSSYLNFTYSADKRMRYMINAHGTETGRFSGSTDPWDNGVNPQTIPGGNKGINIKRIFEATPGYSFLQADLRQAESRFVAYDSADANLIRMLEDSTKDIHKYVASEIFGKPEAEVSKQERQLGKKSGHGANYSVKEATLIDSCIGELDLVLTTAEANKVLESYHKLFPGIRRWHANIRRELAQTRKLQTPLGRERYFWGRLDDDMFREAYAYRPQSTIPDITNHLMLHLMESRKQGAFSFRLLLQNHDSVLMEVPEPFVQVIAKACIATEQWHPEVVLAGGRMIIPVEVEYGVNLGELSKYEQSNCG